MYLCRCRTAKKSQEGVSTANSPSPFQARAIPKISPPHPLQHLSSRRLQEATPQEKGAPTFRGYTTKQASCDLILSQICWVPCSSEVKRILQALDKGVQSLQVGSVKDGSTREGSVRDGSVRVSTMANEQELAVDSIINASLVTLSYSSANSCLLSSQLVFTEGFCREKQARHTCVPTIVKWTALFAG